MVSSGGGGGQGGTESNRRDPSEAVPDDDRPTHTTEPRISDAEARRLLDQVRRDIRAGKITAAEANEAVNRIRCQQGYWSCQQ